jgi:hypothetical protein
VLKCFVGFSEELSFLELKDGELLSGKSFTLFQSLTAVEMMDPRMDAGSVQMQNKTVLDFTQARKVEHLLNRDVECSTQLVARPDWSFETSLLIN